MTQPPQHDPENLSSSPEPERTPGLEPGGGVPPGETPPDPGQMSGAAPDTHQVPNQGPVSGNRTPMVIALGALAVLVLMVALFTGASLFPS